MIARVSTFRGPPEQLEEGIRLFRETVSPWIRDATGYRGFLALVDPEGGKALVTTFWTSREAALDPASSGAALRDDIAETVGTPIEGVELYEVTHAESLALDDESDKPS